jgi:hypothetical protein
VALFGVFLAEEVVEDVGHCLWKFTIPKILRLFFLHHRELLGELCRAGWEVVCGLVAFRRGDFEGKFGGFLAFYREHVLGEGPGLPLGPRQRSSVVPSSSHSQEDSWTVTSSVPLLLPAVSVRQAAVLERLRNVGGPNLFTPGGVSHRAGHPQDDPQGPHRQFQPLEGGV